MKMNTKNEPNEMVAPGRLPLHLQVSEMLTRQIQARVLLHGERLPPEREMAKSLSISVGTLRKALSDLVEKGLLERIQGSGNYIRYKAEVASVYAFFRLELTSGGGLPSAQIISVEKMEKPDDLPAFGNSSAGFRIRRLRYLDQQKAAIEEIWLDGACAEEVEKSALSDSLYRYYNDNLGIRIVRAEDKVSVAKLPLWGAQAYAEETQPFWGYIERLSWDQDGETPEYSRTWFNPEAARFVARWN